MGAPCSHGYNHSVIQFLIPLFSLDVGISPDPLTTVFKTTVMAASYSLE